MSERDPIRLAESGAPEVRELLRAARLDEPSPHDLARLSARLGPAVAAAPPRASRLVRARPWLAIVAAGGLVAGALVWSRRDGRDARPAPAAPDLAPVPPPAPPPTPPVPAPVAVPDVAPRPAPPPAEVPAPPRVRRAPRRADAPAPGPPPAEAPAPVPPAEPPAHPREIELLASAHDALRAKDTARALDLAAEHRRLYPAGTMAEERDALVVEGLLQLGHGDAARDAFARFSTTYPRSGYRARLQRLLGAEP